jgi:Family of unknown function (DUF6267)
MRHLDIMIPQRWLITESKARISHPEDAVFDEGSAGALRALNALIHAAETPHTVSIKWDGSPALIFGNDEHGFVLTDKSGFASKKPGGMPRTAADLQTMLYMRKPDEPGRQEYADSIADLFERLRGLVPNKFKGYLQGDLLWTSTPPIKDGHFVFKPNKIKYSIPVDSPAGKLIATCPVGIAIHSRFENRNDIEPRAIGKLSDLNLHTSQGIVVMGPEIKDLESNPISVADQQKIRRLITKTAKDIDVLFDTTTLASKKITDFPALMKRYVAGRAAAGTHGLHDATQGFIKWIASPASKLTDNKRINVQNWISSHANGYAAAWMVAEQLSLLKDNLKGKVDTKVGSKVKAELQGQPGHEGYVLDTPHGKYKLVNRPAFMNKDQV